VGSRHQLSDVKAVGASG